VEGYDPLAARDAAVNPCIKSRRRPVQASAINNFIGKMPAWYAARVMKVVYLAMICASVILSFTTISAAFGHGVSTMGGGSMSICNLVLDNCGPDFPRAPFVQSNSDLVIALSSLAAFLSVATLVWYYHLKRQDFHIVR
jgi:hypothetical protein